MKRAEYDYGYSNIIGTGVVHGAIPVEEEEAPLATIWVPDPEQRHGWREVYVKPGAAEKPGGKPIGFRR